MTANTGAPIKDVITPMGSSVGEMTVLAVRSANIKKALPVNIDNGNKCL